MWSSDPEALTVASVMGWSRTTAYRVLHEGTLPVIKISRSRYAVSTAVLLAWLDGENAA
jgi:excisionase family DNA binding protein